MATPAQETLEFLARLGQRASRADAARAARVAQLSDEIARTGQLQRGLYGRAVSADGVAYPQYLDQFDDVAERMARLERTRARMTDDRPYLETVRRAYRAPGEPDMSLDSPLFGDMYEADRAFDQLRRGRTSNLRNSGGDLARIASQSIRDADAAAARGASAMDRAGGPAGAVTLGVLGGAAAAGPAGMAIESALEARRKQQAEELAAQRAAEAFAAEQAALKEQYLNDIDGFDPVAADVVSPEFEQKLYDDLASYRGGIRPTTPRAVEAHTRAQGLPTFPGTVISDADHAAGEQFAIQEQFLNDLDGIRTPDMLDVVSPEFDSGLLADMASQSYPTHIKPRSVGAIDNYARQQGLPTFPGTILEDEIVRRRVPAPHFMSPMGRFND